ncbi:helix-turn-helix domain-containing protein [Deinococcus aestuarii]|uniref:helix-turn-helix domain-containing protein n=1 Tax=Deinococcus aestuarii TaxID=2774531 RepID=UPI001C0E585B|nr:helix-turn-helix domain-containing protein [Deinococcus aestuarii]
MNERLIRERERLERAWHRYISSRVEVPAPGEPVPDEVAASWARSAQTVPPERVCAPVENDADVRHAWQESRLEHASRPLLAELVNLAEDGDLIVAVADAGGQLLWTSGSERMHRLASGINFVPGGHWDESSVGTNALALALRTRQAVRVFAAEHFVQTVHDWVCYSAPIRDPVTGELLGVLDFSTTWERSTPLGLASTRHYAGLIEGGLTPVQGVAEGLTLRLCGPPRVVLQGRSLHLTPRQHELLAVMALCPDGLTLDAMHAHVYGDLPVSLSTLKSEISTLRALLGGAVASRPYRLTLGVSFDALSVEAALLSGQPGRALDTYDGPLLPHSASPLLTYWREYLDAALREAVSRARDPELLWRYTNRFDDPELLHDLEALLAPGDPRLPMARARRAALGEM